jgi:hypothetical protein
MQLKRNVMALALLSAGIGLTTCVNVAFAASATTAGAQDQSQPQTDTQPASNGDANQSGKKNTNKKEARKPGTRTLETVQVNGYISSLENSTALKRDANTIVEAVSAEQVGKLPGVSIADALGRLPGLAVQTVDGRPQVLSIHGLGPDFSTALINGGEQVSTNNNRDVAFDQYPSSWFDNVVVHLSPEADLLGQGLAGTVDMHTIRPLDKAGPEAAVNLHYIWNSSSQLADGPEVRNDVDAWMFGHWLLVSPVVQQGQTMKHIYLPAGTWTGWFNGKTYAGGHAIDYPVDARTWADIPLFIRQGAIIPTQRVMQYVGQYPVTSVDVDVFPSSQSTHFDYYDDNGTTYAYEHGAYFLQRLTTQCEGGTVTFSTDAASGSFHPALRDYLVRVHVANAQSLVPAGGKLREYPDEAALKAADGEGWARGRDRFGPVIYLKLKAGVARSVRLAATAHVGSSSSH